MDELNNKKDLPKQNPESGNTYWENGITEQEVSEQTTIKAEIPTQDYQQQTDQTSPKMSVQEPESKKPSKIVITAIALILVLIAATSTAFAFKDTLKNSIALMTKSPADYYAYVEKEAINDSIDKLLPYMNSNSKDMAADVSTDITYDHETVNALLQSSLGMGLDDIEGMLGLSLDSIGFDMLVTSKDNILSDTIGVRLNDVNLITLEFIMNTVQEEMLFRFPELSPAYLRESLATTDSSMTMNVDLLEKLTPERTADLLKRYSTIISDHINQVELEKNTALTLDEITVTSNKLTVTIDKEDVYDIIFAILEEIKTDDYILDLLPLFAVSEDEFINSIEDAKSSFEERFALSEDDSFVMIVYVDKHGDIIGRDFNVSTNDESIGSLGYRNLSNGNNEEFEFYVNNENDDTVFTVNGHQTNKNDAYNGTVTLQITGDALTLPSDISFDIEYDDVRIERKDNRIYQYGNYSISSLTLMGMEIIIQYDVVDEIQHNKVILQMGSSPLVTVKSTVEYLDDYSITQPTDSDVIYDTTDAESYYSTIDIDQYISDLSEKLGVDLQNLINNFLPYLFY